MGESKKQREAAQKLAFWLEHLAAWQQSGLSQAQYCRQAGLCSKSFNYWKRRQGALGNQPAPARVSESLPTIVAVQPEQFLPHMAAPLAVVLHNSLRVEVAADFSVPLLQKLVAALGQLP